MLLIFSVCFVRLSHPSYGGRRSSICSCDHLEKMKIKCEILYFNWWWKLWYGPNGSYASHISIGGEKLWQENICESFNDRLVIRTLKILLKNPQGWWLLKNRRMILTKTTNFGRNRVFLKFLPYADILVGRWSLKNFVKIHIFWSEGGLWKIRLNPHIFVERKSSKKSTNFGQRWTVENP